jgi:protein O-mannosyl-transferase
MWAIILIGLIIYTNSLFNPFVFDDLGLIVQNPTIHSLSYLPAIFLNKNTSHLISSYYRPISQALYAIIYAIFNTQPFWYHLVQIIIHIANSYLIFILFKRHLKPNLALMAGLLFLSHPINQFTVAYISSLHDVLYLFFGLLSLYFFKNLYLSALLTFFCLLSKESGVQFLIIFLSYVWFFDRRKFKAHSISLLFVALGYLSIRLLSHTPFVKDPLVPIMTLSLSQRLLHIPAIVFYYFKTYFFPIPLTAFHSWTITKISLTNFFLPALVDLLIIIGLLALLYRQKSNQNLGWFFFIWFAIGLGIHLQIIPIDMTVSDHFFYSAQVGLVGLLLFFINDQKRSPVIFLSIIIAVYTLLTFTRNTIWTSQSSILAHDQEYSQNDYLQELLYAGDLLAHNQLATAKTHIQKAIFLYPQSGRAYNVLGGIYYQQNQIENARTAYLKSISLTHYYAAYENLGLLSIKYDPATSAAVFLRQATTIFPQSDKLWFYRIIVENKLGNYEQALASAKNYYLLTGDSTSKTIYSRLLQSLPINIELK